SRARRPRRPPAHAPSLRRRAARADRFSARRGEGMPPRLPILASRAPRQPRRPPDAPRARAEAAGVAAEASPPRAGSEGSFAAAGGPRGRRDRPPPQLPRAPAAHGGTRRPTERAWSEDREPGAAPPPPARTVPSSGYRFAAESFSQSLAAIVSSGPNRATRASWSSAALPTTTIATASGGGMSFAAVSATCSGVTAATRSR